MSDIHSDAQKSLLDRIAVLVENNSDQALSYGLFEIAIEQAKEKDPELDLLMYSCSMPNYFTVETIGVMRDHPEDLVRNQELLDHITSNSFVRKEERGFSYHEELRDEILEKIKSSEIQIEGLDEVQSRLRKHFLESWRTQFNGSNYSDALIALSSLEVIDESEPNLFFLKAITSSNAGNLVQAKNAIDQLLILDPENESGLKLSVDVALSMDDFETAERNVQQLMQQHNYEDASDFVQLALIKIRQNDLQGALGGFNRAIEVNADEFGAYINRGITYGKMERYEEALADFNRAIEINVDDFGAYYNRGVTSGKMGRYEEALLDFNRVIALDPEEALPYVSRGNTYNKMGRYEEALADLTRAIALDREYAQAYSNRGSIYSNMGRDEEALADLTRAIAVDPEYAHAYNNRGSIYGNMGRDEEALADYTRAIALDREYALAYNNRGSAYGNMGRHEEALADFTRAIDLDHEDAVAYYNRGSAYNEMGRYEEALADFTRALEIDSEDISSYDSRGLLLSKMRRYDEALRDYEGVLKIDKTTVTALYNRAVAYTRMNGIDQARNYIRIARKNLDKKDVNAERAYYGKAGLLALEKNDQCLVLLAKAINAGTQAKNWARTDIAWDDYQGDERFEKLIK